VISIYGILISISIALSVYLAEHLIKKDGRNPEYFWGLTLYTLVAGIAGARLYHVLDFYKYYIQHPLYIPALWSGGMSIIGAVLGGVFGLFIYSKKNKLDIIYWLDIAAVVTPLAQAIGRWGNFFNKEIFGLPTDVFWGIFIPEEKRPEGFESFVRFHPLFLYESLLNLLLFLFLYHIKTKAKKHTGIIFWLYIAGYSCIRFLLEFLRIRPWSIAGINVAQAICLVAGTFAAIALVKKKSVA
jgi:phosphatidylglycerol:prolipoprotein diacylglycerol transferase